MTTQLCTRWPTIGKKVKQKNVIKEPFMNRWHVQYYNEQYTQMSCLWQSRHFNFTAAHNMRHCWMPINMSKKTRQNSGTFIIVSCDMTLLQWHQHRCIRFQFHSQPNGGKNRKKAHTSSSTQTKRHKRNIERNEKKHSTQNATLAHLHRVKKPNKKGKGRKNEEKWDNKTNRIASTRWVCETTENSLVNRFVWTENNKTKTVYFECTNSFGFCAHSNQIKEELSACLCRFYFQKKYPRCQSQQENFSFVQMVKYNMEKTHTIEKIKSF